MKKLLSTLIVAGLVGSGCLYASNDTEEVKQEVKEAMEEVREELQDIRVELGGKVIAANLDANYEKPYMGVYEANITLTKARELNYTEFYGVLVTGVSSNSPARLYRLLEDDIIMEIDGQKIWNSKSLSKTISAHYVGDNVTITIFRNGEKKDLPFVFGSRNKKTIVKNGSVKIIETNKKSRKRRKSVGHGGGGWIPMVFQPEDINDINEIIKTFEFREFDDDFFFMNGLGGAGNVGKGYFIGGMGVWKSEDKKINTIVTPELGDAYDVIRRMQFSIGFGGVTVDKRFALTKNWVFSIGSMLGWGGYNVKVSEVEANADWDNPTAARNRYWNFKKNYIFVQPRITTLVMLNDWLGIRAQAGYNAGYSFYEGWRDEIIDESFELPNSPDSTFNGYTFSIGPWFGF